MSNQAAHTVSISSAAPAATQDGGGGVLGAIVPDSLTRALGVLSDGAVWARVGTIMLGLWLVYIGALIWIASNEQVRQAAGAVAGAVATKNPSALAAAV